MPFYKRLQLYLIGFLLGCILVYFLFEGKGCKMPGTLKLNELNSQSLFYTKHANCRMLCRGIEENEVVHVLKTGKVNFSKSDAQNKPCPTYAVEGKTLDNQEIRIIIADCDTISKIVTAIDLNLKEDSCACD